MPVHFSDDMMFSSLLGEKERDPHQRIGNYELSYRRYMFPGQHKRDWYFVSPLGDPFPSYHSNPEPNFPARWTKIPGVRRPCENITAPRIRLGPNELESNVEVITQLQMHAAMEDEKPQPRVLNLCYQSLGDPYQYDTLRAFLELNSTVEILNLDGNELEDITDLNLKNVRVLHLSENNFISFLGIPELPNCEELHMRRNFLTGTHGLTAEKFPRLKKICVFQNPFETQYTYRQELIEKVPTLEVIDFYVLKNSKRFKFDK